MPKRMWRPYRPREFSDARRDKASRVNDLYETNITDTRWIAYDIPGNVGWIVYFICCYRLIRAGIEPYAISALIPAALMLVGIIELISERIAKLDRVLPKKRLWRGFGLLMLGGILGAVVAFAGFSLEKSLSFWMLVGAVLCAVFAGLLFMGYKRR